MIKTGFAARNTDQSLLPTLYRAAYKELGLKWDFELYPCETVEGFESLIKTAKRENSGFVGLVVGVPYTGDANRLAFGHSQDESFIKHANMLTFNAGQTRSYAGVYADNTYGRGIIATLQQAEVELEGKKVVLCGSGPVAMSALFEFGKADVGAVTILSRDPETTQRRMLTIIRSIGRQRYDFMGRTILSGNRGDAVRFASNIESIIQRLMPKTEISSLPYEMAAQAISEADLLINATPLGMFGSDPLPVPETLLRSDFTVLDAVYKRGSTALISKAQAAGAVALDGFALLIEQAAYSIELWVNAQGFSVEAPREVMRKALAL